VTQKHLSAKTLFASTRTSPNAQGEYEAFVAAHFCRYAMRFSKEADFQIRGSVLASGGFKVCRFQTKAGRTHLERTEREIQRDSQNSYLVCVPFTGDQEIEQFSRNVACQPGTLTLIAMNDAFVQKKLGDNDTFYLFLPGEFVDKRVVHGEDLCIRPIPATSGLGGLARESIMSFVHNASAIDNDHFTNAAGIVGELVLFALNGGVDIGSDLRSVRMANLARAKRVIRGHFQEPDLTPADVAAACGLSLRYVQELFQDDGRTICEYMREQRLNHARALLTSGGVSSVTQACFLCGFSNASQFSTAFRQSFGVSPRAVLRHG
jgi:AraC-like DNA-binding protein